jgi:LPXTG-site transpeptidase (sortase) family protein
MALPQNTAKNKQEKQKKPLRNNIFWVLVYVSLGLLLLIGVTLILREEVLITGPYTPPTQSLPADSPTLAPLAPPTPVGETPDETPFIRVAPVMIYFDERERQCEIEPVGLAEDNTIGTVPSATIAGWFDMGASPGDPGNSIISGHVAWRGKKGTFSVLHDMKPGERVTIELKNGELRYFEVLSREEYKLVDFPYELIEIGGDTRLTLVTCLGDYDSSIGTSRTRVVVVCEELRALRRSPADASADTSEEESAQA